MELKTAGHSYTLVEVIPDKRGLKAKDMFIFKETKGGYLTTFFRYEIEKRAVSDASDTARQRKQLTAGEREIIVTALRMSNKHNEVMAYVLDRLNRSRSFVDISIDRVCREEGIKLVKSKKGKAKKVLMRNVTTGEETIFPSMEQLLREIDISPDRLNECLRTNRLFKKLGCTFTRIDEGE